MIAFSVLMPVYKKEKPSFLASALETILVSQTIIPKELIIVADGPLTSGLDAVLDQYFETFPSVVKVYRLEKNMGMGYAMNYGLNKCSNEWVFRMDSDDIALPFRFEKQLEIIASNKYDVIGSSTQEFNELIGDLDQFRVMPEHHSDIVKFMKTRNPINHMTVAFKKSLAIEAGGYWDRRYFEDYNLWYEMSKVGAQYYNIQEILVYARIGNNMVSRRSGYSYFKHEVELMKKFYADKFVNGFEYRFFLAIKFIMRILPVSLLTVVYKKFLRKK